MKLYVPGFGCLVQKPLGACRFGLPCSKGFRRMKLCGPRFGCLIQKGFRRMKFDGLQV